MKEIKFSTTLLMTLVLAVWGTIAYQIIASLNEDDGAPGEVSTVQSERQLPLTMYKYKNDVRDPFRFSRQGRQDTTRGKKGGLLAWVPPPLKLTGILNAGRKKTAMIESAGGRVFFLQEGDTVHGTKILKISENNVRYVFQKKKDAWSLDGKQR